MKKQIAYVIAAIMAISTAVPILAADNIKTRDAQLRSDFTIVVDGKEVGFRSADGKAVYPVLYNGSTYLPLRAVGELMGKNVNWDEQNKVVTLSGTRDTVSMNGLNAKVDKKVIRVQERPDFTIVVDNEKKKFQSVLGREIYPILYNGSTYLPLRAIGEIMEQDVVWDGREKKITLGTKENGFTVTDADSFQQNNEINSSNKEIITREKAKEIALDHARLSPSQVKFVKAKQDMENGALVYEIEFYAGNKEYDYKIDAKTGKILSYDLDTDVPLVNQPNHNKITLEKAKEIALRHLGLNDADVHFTKTKQEYDNGMTKYEIELDVNGIEHDFEISASGKIMEYSADND